MKMKKKSRNRFGAGNALWSSMIEPHCVHAEENRGFTPRVAEELSRVVGFAIKPQQVREWLARDPKTRVEPKAGVGMLLIQAIQNVRGGK